MLMTMLNVNVIVNIAEYVNMNIPISNMIHLI